MIERVAVVGAGRVGLTLARALVRSGVAVTVLSRRARTLPRPLAPASTEWSEALGTADLVLLAVPDDAIAATAAGIATLGVTTPRQAILHCSGLHDRAVLAPLASTGAALGSIHVAQTFTNPLGEPEALAGSPAVIEGDVHALAAARALAALLGLEPVVAIAGDAKAKYHAAAVFASNYVVALAAVAERLARDAGLGESASTLFAPLMRRTVEHLATGDVAGALTGPVRRGDAGTVGRHLDVLDDDDRLLYVALAREALQLARRAGLDRDGAAAVERVLATDRSSGRQAAP